MLILTHPTDTSHSRGPRRKERSDWPSRVHPCGAPEIAGSFSAREPQASYTAAASSRRQTTPPFFFPLGLTHGRVILSISCSFNRSFLPRATLESAVNRWAVAAGPALGHPLLKGYESPSSENATTEAKAWTHSAQPSSWRYRTRHAGLRPAWTRVSSRGEMFRVRPMAAISRKKRKTRWMRRASSRYV